MEFILYFDESEDKGKYYSNFYGGALVSSKDFEQINQILNDKKSELGFEGEIKWSKVTSNYLDKYIEMMDTFFSLVKANRVKVRIMFRQNCHQAINLTEENQENGFYLLYYQFCKHAFGLQYCNPEKKPINLRLYFDKLPDTKEKNQQFKSYIHSLQYQDIFLENNISVIKEDIVEVESHDHVVLQCMDIVMGAMQFRLNNKHLIRQPGQRRRGKRTIAKHKLYKHINKLIREIYPNFNIGISTGGSFQDRWEHPYRHWNFTPYQSEYIPEKTKSYKYKNRPHRSY